MTFDTILDEAAALVDGPRQEAYGSPRTNFSRIAAMMSQILGIAVTAEQAALCMIAVKLGRCAHKIGRDTLVDIAGYARVVEKILEEPLEAELTVSTGAAPLFEIKLDDPLTSEARDAIEQTIRMQTRRGVSSPVRPWEELQKAVVSPRAWNRFGDEIATHTGEYSTLATFCGAPINFLVPETGAGAFLAYRGPGSPGAHWDWDERHRARVLLLNTEEIEALVEGRMYFDDRGEDGLVLVLKAPTEELTVQTIPDSWQRFNVDAEAGLLPGTHDTGVTCRGTPVQLFVPAQGHETFLTCKSVRIPNGASWDKNDEMKCWCRNLGYDELDALVNGKLFAEMRDDTLRILSPSKRV